ncbi:MAG: hypothetical protein WCA63_07980, partial [Gallionella sp.]
AETMQFELVKDRKGMIWDLLLYIPTVIALASIATSFWYGGDHNMGYLFFFLTCFFFIAGFNRIFKTRLMLLPSAPVCLKAGEQSLGLVQRNGVRVDLVKNLRYYPDYSGKSFGISGLDGAGKQLQFVFHRGQFATVSQYESVQTLLKRHLK